MFSVFAEAEQRVVPIVRKRRVIADRVEEVGERRMGVG